MSDTANIQIQDALVTINFRDLEKYNPARNLDEIVFFQYLVFKCGSNAGEWWQSAKNIQTKLKIRRIRLSKIIELFTAKGVLASETKGFRNNRHYSLNFEQVAQADFLEFIYDWPRLSKQEQKAAVTVYKALLKRHPPEKTHRVDPVNVTRPQVPASEIERIGDEMESIWHDRRKYFNVEKLGTRTLAQHPLIFTKKHAKQLEKALVYFDSPEAGKYIINAYLAYCDEVNNAQGGNIEANSILTEDSPKTDILAFFLASKDGFQTINSFSTTHSGYGYERK